MFTDYDAKKLEKVLSDFSLATKININFVDADFSKSALCNLTHNEYCRAIQETRDGCERCRASDTELMRRCKETKKPETHLCHAGLVDIAVPLFHNETLLGYIILGQMKTTADFSDAKKLTARLGLDARKMQEYYEKLPIHTDEAVRGVTGIAEILAKYVILEDLLTSSANKDLKTAVAFIERNISERLSIQYISKSINVSKTTLYKIFRENYSCTPSEYINERRVDVAKQLLRKTDLSMEEVSRRVGFSSAAYFTKTFKKYTDTSPLKFKKTAK